MMETPASIEQVKAEIRKCGEKLKRKRNFRAVQNSRVTLGYMGDLERGYSWTNYINGKDLLELPRDEFTCFIRDIINERDAKSSVSSLLMAGT